MEMGEKQEIPICGDDFPALWYSKETENTPKELLNNFQAKFKLTHGTTDNYTTKILATKHTYALKLQNFFFMLH